ncbi:MAG: mobile mystery protein B [Gemmatimonadetes bacterium]|nr:mobile mystery protein B [Gemmatimonadota bacterium]
MSEGLFPSATPLDPDETDDLIPGHLQTREELNRWEQENIVAATRWTLRTRASALDEGTIRELHRRMFDRTWGWAGLYRRSDKNIGVHWQTIPVEVRKFVDDGAYWIRERVFELDEAAVRLHHRLVQIHPFPDGNGRHARLWCDLLLGENSRKLIAWENDRLGTEGEARSAYIGALRAADEGDFGPLRELLLAGRA